MSKRSILDEIHGHHYDSENADVCEVCKRMKQEEDDGASITEGTKGYYHTPVLKKSKSKRETCYGCMEKLPGQMAHMGPGGCMEVHESEEEEEGKKSTSSSGGKRRKGKKTRKSRKVKKGGKKSRKSKKSRK